MDVLSLGPLPVASLVWQPGPGRYALTVVCKATFDLAPVTSELSAHQEAPNEEDNHWDDDPARSLYSPSDLAPFKPRADILLVGHAFAPRGEPVRCLVARLLVGELDKAIEVFGERTFTRQGGLREVSRFAKMPLRYERAAGGPGTKNPVGVRSDATDPYGAALFPNLQPVGISVSSPSDYIEPIAFGPIAPTWRDRIERLGPHAALAQGGLHRRPLPEGFDGSFFNAAPRDQQADVIRSGERLVLENLHWEHPRLVTSLRGVHPQAFAEIPGTPPAEIPMVCDTLWIDTDRALCTLTWRGQVQLQRPAQEGRVLVAMASPGQRLAWADVARLRGEVSPASRGPQSSPGGPPRVKQQSEVEIIEHETVADGRDDSRDVTASPDDLARFRAAMPFFDPKGPMTPVPMPPVPPAPPRPPSPPGRGTGTAPGTTNVPSSITGAPASSAPQFLPPRPGQAAPPAMASPPMPPPAPASSPMPPPAPASSPMPPPGMASPPMPPPPAMASPPMPPPPAMASPPMPPAAMASPPMPPPPAMASPPMPPPPAMAPPPMPPPPAMAPPASPWAAGTPGDFQSALPAPAPSSSQIIPSPRLRPAEPSAPESSATPRPPPKSDAWLSSSSMIPSLAAAAAQSGAAAAQSGAAAASTAAAAASAPTASIRAPTAAKPQPTAPAAPRNEARELLDLLWFDQDSVRRMRSYKPWRAALTEAASEWLDTDPSPKTASKASDRADVLRVLLRVKPLDGDGIVASMASSIDEDSAFTPPLVVVAGELHFPFDDTEILKAYVAGATPFLGTDKKLREIVDTAGEVLRSPWPGSRGLVESLASRLKEAFGQGNRALPPAYLETSAEQVLLEQRRYQKRTLLGQDRLRGLLTPQGGGSPVPTYLPDSLARQLPMFQRFRAVIVAEAHGQQDQYETHPIALVGLALARVLPIPTLQSR